LFVQQFENGRPAGDLLNLPPTAAASAVSANIVFGSGAHALVAARGWGEALEALPSAAYALKATAGAGELPPKPVYARAPDAKAKAA
jgi:hypothetical protein